MMKKLLLFSLLVSAMVGLAACGSDSKKESVEEEESSEEVQKAKEPEFLKFIEKLREETPISNPVGKEKACEKINKFFNDRLGKNIDEFYGIPFQIWPDIFSNNYDGTYTVPFMADGSFDDTYKISILLEVRLTEDKVSKLDTRKRYYLKLKTLKEGWQVDILRGGQVYIDELKFEDVDAEEI